MDLDRIGPYRLEGRIGVGGMGVVYRAFDERLDRWVAVKLIAPEKSGDPQRRERLRREARASARLSHPAIVHIYDFVQTEQGDGIVMELVEGEPLSRVLRNGPLDLPRAFPLARQIAEALAEAHAKGIVHRDLKSENVIVTPSGQAKVLDFGIAKRLDGADMTLTADGVVLGTCRSMAPEQAEGEQVDHRADLFSFGVLLYEILTGESPFMASNPAAMLRRICDFRQVPAQAVNTRVPSELSSLIDQLLEKDPEKRPQGAAAVAASLARMAASVSSEAVIPEWLDFTLPELTPIRTPGRPTTTPGSDAGSGARRSGSLLSSAGERRQVTVLRCGLTGPGGRPLDPEELIESTPRLHALVAEAGERYEGSVESRGHGCFIYFGYPEAHEDDPRRAVSAALEIAARAGGEALAVRVGVHTGAMVVTRTATGGGDDLALGETPNEAALVQSLAEPGAVTVSPVTWRLVAGFFDGEELAPVTFPGTPEPVRAVRVLAGKGTQGRIVTADALTPLVGREQELDLLLQRWALAKEGRGQGVLLVGEAGVGKSRLVWELQQRVTADGSDWVEIHGSNFHRNSSLYPFIELLRRRIGGDAEPSRLTRLEQLLSLSGLPLGETVPLFLGLLSLPQEDGYVPPAMSPETQRRKTMEAMLALFLALAERQPMLLIAEDLHWFDPTSLELLGLLLEHAAGSPVLLLLTFRPEFEPPWGQRGDPTRLNLPHLSRNQTGLMVERLLEGQELAPAVREQILARTDGLPLFIEELTRMLLDAGGTDVREGRGSTSGRGSSAAEIPLTLEGWLNARLDKLGGARDVAQLAAVLGREFSYELLREVSPWSEGVLQGEVERLVEAQILFRRGVPPRHRYLFKHALLQDAAYASMLRSDRQGHHRRIAGILEERFADTATSQPELLAHHYTEGGAAAAAVAWWKRAADKAMARSANQEAIGHATRALELLAGLPDSPERDAQEIAFQVILAAATGLGNSYADPMVEQAVSRAWELCNRAGTTPHLVPVYLGFFALYLVRGRLDEALTSTEKLLELAERLGDRELFLIGHQRKGFALLCRAEFPAARFHLEEALTYSDAARASFDNSIVYPVVDGLCDLCLVLWMMGFPEQAVARSREAIERAREIGYSYTLGYALSFAAELHMFRNEPDRVLEITEELVALSTQQSLLGWLSYGVFLRGWAMATRGNVVEGMAMMRHVIEGNRAAGVRIGQPSRFASLARVCVRAGLPDEGLAAVEEALGISADGAHHFVDAELWRLRGELLAARGEDAEAEDAFRQSLDTARSQGARSLELRAAMSLARFQATRGGKDEARGRLAQVYEGFTEGFDAPDLREARSLLDELLESPSE